VTKGRRRPPPVSPKHSGLRGRRSLSAKDRIIAILENQLAEERAASGELRRIIAALTQRIPELEARSSSKSQEPPRALRRSRRGRHSPGPLVERLRSPQSSGARGGGGCSGDSVATRRLLAFFIALTVLLSILGVLLLPAR
jgi:hypothetical protein